MSESSGGDRILGLQVDAAGNVMGANVIADGFNNPLDVAVHGPSGRIYVVNSRGSFNLEDDQLILLDPVGDVPVDPTPDPDPETISAIAPDYEFDLAGAADAFYFHEIEELTRRQRDRREDTITVENTSDVDVTVADFEVTGPFSVIDPAALVGVTIAAGGSLDIDVLFDADGQGGDFTDANGGAVYEGSLNLIATDPTIEDAAVALRGLWAPAVGGANEPLLESITEFFGWANFADGTVVTQNDVSFQGVPTLVAGEAAVEVDGELREASYFQAANPDEDITVLQVFASHGTTAGSPIRVRAQTYDETIGDVTDTAAYTPGGTLAASGHDVADSQTIFPYRTGSTVDLVEFSFDTEAPFSFEIAGRSTDANLNADGDLITVLELFDANGDRVEDTYLIGQDFGPGRFNDYNDNVYLVTNIDVFDGFA